MKRAKRNEQEREEERKKMKKFAIVLAAIAAFTCAFGGACGPTAKPTSWVYAWKFVGHTTEGGKYRFVSSACGAGDPCTFRTKASLKIQGYTYLCSPGCGSESFEAFSEANEVFWQTKPVRASIAGGVTTEICNIIGKSKKQCEIAGTALFTLFTDDYTTVGTYAFMYAGFGKYDKRKSRVKSATGNFAGVYAYPTYSTGCQVITAGVWDCATLQLVCEDVPSILYGKWSVKFKKSASKQYEKGVAPKLPKWVLQKNLD